MARTLYCRHQGCGATCDSVAGYIPPTCPDCKRESKWSTTPGSTPYVERRKKPRVAYVLNHNDKRFLISLRIATDDESPANNDSDCDGA